MKRLCIVLLIAYLCTQGLPSGTQAASVVPPIAFASQSDGVIHAAVDAHMSRSMAESCLGCHHITASQLQAALPPPSSPPPLASLKQATVPEPSNLADFVQNKNVAIQLGKAFFWDMQLGSDGIQACASCHFNAGADNRFKDQVNPGTVGEDTKFEVGGANGVLLPDDFPLTRHDNANGPNSPIAADSNDIISSQGVFKQDLVSGASGSAADQCANKDDQVFHELGKNVRQTQERNTPSVINAVFNFRNFWDGRANAHFNGADILGQGDPNAGIYLLSQGQLQKTLVDIPLASLASQAMGPPTNPTEMACSSRTFPQIGRKLLNSGVTPLANQLVSSSDSVLGTIARSKSISGATGLTKSYATLVQQAFKSQYWNSSQQVTIGGTSYNQMEANFSLFFGLSIQLYEATLVSDDTPLDRFLTGNTSALTVQQQRGLSVFQNKGRCLQCHNGPEMTNASVSSVSQQPVKRMVMGDGGCAIYDTGFYNIGVRPTAEDIGVGGDDDIVGNPLSFTSQAMQGQTTTTLDPPLGQNAECDYRANIDGTFKTPGLRNVELTGPYFHNGGQGTLRQVVDFYDRGGDFGQKNLSSLDANIQFLELDPQDKEDLVALLLGLTDERVRWERAPFDHPALCVPNGQVDGTSQQADANNSVQRSNDEMRCLPAVGASGASTPLKPFLDMNPYQP